jgi:photosystem II stability/assembly factor-like uncharacterized protein
VKVGAGGYIPGIVFSRAQKGLAYLRSDMGGCYRWDDARKTWVPLQDAMSESSYHGGESIASDPVDPNVVYVAAGMYRREPSAILRSRDRGETWEVFPVGFQMGGNEDGRGLGERLAVDPNDTSILYFGSRHDGLQRSTDHGQTWTQVASFPLKGRGAPPDWNHPTNGGLSFVVFDPKSAARGARGSASRTIFVGSADPGEHHLFRSDDAGETWRPVSGGPAPEMLPAQAQIDDDGRFLYVTYGSGLPPTNVPAGCVMKLDIQSGQWTDITPDERSKQSGGGGYCGLSLDRQKPGTLAVATMNRWSPVDTVWRSTDGGKTWKDIAANSERDVSSTPFLLWGKDKAKLGWWMSALAIDPFDSDHVCYATGATIYASNDFSRASSGQATHWRPWVQGIEQTAIITMCSPTVGAPLLSGFGDIGGFRHDDLDVSPTQGMYENPQFGNTNTIDFAERQPNVVVRSGRPNDNEANLGYSEDGGRTWKPLTVSAHEQSEISRRGNRFNPPIVVSADGSTFIVMTRPTPQLTRDRGGSWTAIEGLPANARIVTDRQDADRFYALDFTTGRLFTSTDGGRSFVAFAPQGLPADTKRDEPTWHEAAWPLMATTGRAGDLWFVSKMGLYHSSDGGRTFARAAGDSVAVDVLGFGKRPDGKDYPALFAIGTRGNLKAIWRSDDAGETWLRVNDDQHQYGTRFRCIAGDPRVFGRVYVGTDGRGILYGEPAPTPADSAAAAPAASAKGRE